MWHSRVTILRSRSYNFFISRCICSKVSKFDQISKNPNPKNSHSVWSPHMKNSDFSRILRFIPRYFWGDLKVVSHRNSCQKPLKSVRTSIFWHRKSWKRFWKNWKKIPKILIFRCSVSISGVSLTRGGGFFLCSSVLALFSLQSRFPSPQTPLEVHKKFRR